MGNDPVGRFSPSPLLLKPFHDGTLHRHSHGTVDALHAGHLVPHPRLHREPAVAVLSRISAFTSAAGRGEGTEGEGRGVGVEGRTDIGQYEGPITGRGTRPSEVPAEPTGVPFWCRVRTVASMLALPHDRTGARIKRLRLERHLTQRALADLSTVPYSTLTKVEQGVTVASPHIIASAARALRVEVATVTGQPYTAELRQDELDVLIRPIREALDVYDLGADPDITPRPHQLLADDAESLLAIVRAGEIKRAAGQVAGLMQEATTAAHTASCTEGWLLLASTYRTAHDVASKLGFGDLTAIAPARMDWAAQRGADAVVGGMYRYMRALTYLREGQYRTGDRLICLGLSTLEQADQGRERDVLAGQPHLGAAVMAGRGQDKSRTELHLDEAERIAASTGEAVKVHWLSFGPTNVRVHRVSVAAELDEYATAAEAGSSIRFPREWPASRRSHHYAELTRAQMWTGDLPAAISNLLAARKTAPQQARYHPTIRETHAGLEAAKRQLPDSFLSYGSWLKA